MKQINFEEFGIKKFCANSLMLENKRNGAIVYISRNVFNTLAKNPKLPCFLVNREFNGGSTDWIAVPMTF